MNYIEIVFTHLPNTTNDLLIALLSEMQYEGFEEQPGCLKAFIPKTLFDEVGLKEICQQLQITYTKNNIAEANWNAVWESNFQPVIIGNCLLRAAFHQPVNDVEHEIIITPKMSFGTGHHPTTYMMIEQMQQIDFKNKRVLDFGTGTGVLAILAHKLGAANIVAVDNDNFSIENAAENFSNNHVEDIQLIMADTAQVTDTFDIILANITRNIIQENMPFFGRQLEDGGKLLLSGLLNNDDAVITPLAINEHMDFIKKTEKDNWLCLLFEKDDSYLL